MRGEVGGVRTYDVGENPHGRAGGERARGREGGRRGTVELLQNSVS